MTRKNRVVLSQLQTHEAFTELKEHLEIVDKLEPVISRRRVKYPTGMSDETVAKKIGAEPDAVKNLRAKHFGVLNVKPPPAPEPSPLTPAEGALLDQLLGTTRSGPSPEMVAATAYGAKVDLSELAERFDRLETKLIVMVARQDDAIGTLHKRLNKRRVEIADLKAAIQLLSEERIKLTGAPS